MMLFLVSGRYQIALARPAAAALRPDRSQHVLSPRPAITAVIKIVSKDREKERPAQIYGHANVCCAARRLEELNQCVEVRFPLGDIIFMLLLLPLVREP